MNVVSVEKLSFRYGSAQKGFEFPDVSIKKGEHLLIAGNSGSGKTTFLHLLSGILSPSGGSVSIDNTRIDGLKSHEMDSFRGEKIGIIFQENYFIESLSVLSNLVYIRAFCGQKADKTYIDKLLNDLGIAHLARKKPRELSRGELQRFSIARALVNKPMLLLADEPTSSLDDENCTRFIELMKDICNSYQLSLLVATHDARLKSEFSNCITL